MVRLLILADDFTGALDTGIQLVKGGAAVSVATDLNIRFDTIDPEIQVIVVDTETRHLSADRARGIVRDITSRAVTAGIGTVYKKTDSALRGNIGAELEGALEGAGADKLSFIPAFPKLGRITCGGSYYFDGVPIHETVFGKDPFEPVLSSYVPDIIRVQSEMPVVLVCRQEEMPDTGNRKSIILFDTHNEEDLAAVAKRIRKANASSVLAGCAGFAAYLPEILELERRPSPVYTPTSGLLAVSGSLNPITLRQIKAARESGFDIITAAPELKSEQNTEQNAGGILLNAEDDAFLDGAAERYNKNRRLLVTSVNPDISANMPFVCSDIERRAIANSLGRLVSRLLERGLRCSVMATGGDTLLGVLNSLDCKNIMPLHEIETGVVLSQAETAGGKLFFVSKSGGIGTEHVFKRAADFVDKIY